VRSRWIPIACVLALWLLVGQTAWAGKRSMIPPGREAVIRELIERALASDPHPTFRIDRDRIHVTANVVAADGLEAPRFVIFHPEVEPHGELGESLAPGVVIECGPAAEPRRCDPAERERWRASAEALARERDPVAAEIWQIEESGVDSRSVAGQPSAPDLGLDRVGMLLGLLGGLIVLGLESRSPTRSRRRLHAFEWLGLLGLLVVFVACTIHYTSPWPLHEHNSFVARADCAIDERCLDDPAAAWSPTSLHGYGLILAGFGLGSIGPWLSWLVGVSVALSVIVVVMVWGLTRRVVVELGYPDLARPAALLAAAVLCVHPVYWRLAGAASFWPLALIGLLGAALAGLWASSRSDIGAATLGWTVAACSFAFACGGNVVLLTLTPLALLAPLCWMRSRAASRPGLRLVIVGSIASVMLGLLIVSDVRYGLARAAGSVAASDYPIRKLLREFDPLLFDARMSAWIWAPLIVAALAWTIPAARARLPEPASIDVHPLRLLAPIGYAWVVPHLFLGVAASELIGSGYPVGFINHHWELVGSAVAVGLGSAWVLGWWSTRAGQRWQSPACVGVVVVALLLGPCAGEGWRMATGELVVERELAALQRHFPALPEHDRLIVAPRILEVIDGVSHRGDPIEVVFPIVAYQRAMRGLGREPALVDELDTLARRAPDANERVLVYVGTSLRSFLPAEIAAGVVPDGLERAPLLRLRDRWVLEPVLEFELRTEQHEAVSMRLGADRAPVIELGFYWLRAR
jgi:hypothetical protein